MEQSLERLLKLQEIDLRIHELEQSKVDFPREVEQREALIAEARTSAEAAGKKIAAGDTAIKAVDDAVDMARAALDKSQDRLNAITSNREYDAVHAEIETHKATIAGAQNKLKTLGDEKEKAAAAAQEAQQRLEAIIQEHEAVIADLKGKIATIDQQIAEVQKERAAIAATITRPFLSTYEFIRKKRKSGKVLAYVNADRTCGVCFKVLESRVIMEIKRGKKLPVCEICGSLLIWHDDAPMPAPEESKQ